MADVRNKIGPHSQRNTFGTLDGRGVVARRLKERTTEIADDYGGVASLSVAQRRAARMGGGANLR